MWVARSEFHKNTDLIKLAIAVDHHIYSSSNRRKLYKLKHEASHLVVSEDSVVHVVQFDTFSCGNKIESFASHAYDRNNGHADGFEWP
jgi:hypothetical protein